MDNINRNKYYGLVSKIMEEARGYVVDTSANLIFFNPVYASIEYFIAGLEPTEVLKTRINMSVFNLFISRPYGKFREIWARILKTDEYSSKVRKFITDTSGAITFYTPIYAFSLWMADTSLEEIARALPVGITTSLLVGRPYGLFLDKYRKSLGVKPTLDSYIKEEN